ncbi:hypothetical protein [Eikenella sp. Marseille-P7795]|uniref:hypothetical protein n=1 Tax=Eikenella sp. Marseille-P7795 TaxID=2866577 RepID=UPI001CE4435C|nr:hypothetical protein [Eikenella sp. Marseille-P7795]
MNAQQQQAVIRLGNRLYHDAIAAAQAAQADGTSGHLATAAYNQLAGVWETMQAVRSPDSTAADHITRLIDQLNQRQGNQNYD